MTVGDCITIVFTALFTALLSEFITFLLVYRTEKYQRLNSVIEKGSKVLSLFFVCSIGLFKYVEIE